MSGCAAVGCSNRGDKGFFMKSFPRDPERRALWASQMERDGWQPNNNSRLCEVHFDDDQWEKTRQDGSRKLKCTAVPTLFNFPKQTIKRKGGKPKIIVPLTAEALSVDNIKSEASLHFKQCSKNPKRRVVETDEENSINNPTEPMLKSILRPGLVLEDKSTAQSEPQTHFSNKIDKSRFEHETEALGSGCFEIGNHLVLEDMAIPNMSKGENFDGVKSEDLQEETREKIKAFRSSGLLRNREFSIDQNCEVDINEAEDIRCRLCAGRNDKKNIPIFGESDLAEKISRCLPVIILPTDNLPLEICEQCLDNLNICYEMITGSLKADSILRSELLKTHKSRASGEQNNSNSLIIQTKEEPVFRINGPIKCDLCDNFFKDMNVFDKHIETDHLLQWRCSLCDHSFETSQELLAHKTLNHSGQIQSCKSCANLDSVEEIDRRVCERLEKAVGLAVESGSERSLDKSTETKEMGENLPDLNCTKCKISFDNAKQFRKHHTIHLPRRIKCSVCLKRCPSIFDYLTHVRVFHNQMKRSNSSKRKTVHGCKYCRKVFLIKQQLIIHLRKHKKEMMDDPSVTVYKCVTCPKKFVDRALYQKHRNVHDPACWHKFRCNICDRSFVDKFKLKIHQSIHDGVKPYQCDVCGTMFNRNANMIRHRLKHFEQTCRHCDNTFVNTQSLREHLKDIHGDTLNPKNNTKAGTADRNKTNPSSGDNFICRYCGKQLTSYYSLLDHERIHTGDKPYVCQSCGKAFRSITARWDHMVRHKKENLVCELCGKIMSNKLNLKRHLRKHAAIEQRKFECKECGKLFHMRWRLNAHLVRIHHSAPSN